MEFQGRRYGRNLQTATLQQRSAAFCRTLEKFSFSGAFSMAIAFNLAYDVSIKQRSGSCVLSLHVRIENNVIYC